jgi:GNAT superfamily N-acetyltransferase
MWQAVTDLAQRRSLPLEGTEDDWWASSEAEFTFLSRTAAEWWVAEDPGTGGLIGYARSIARGGLVELTEFFVRPGEQARGVGRALLARAFPADRGEVRSIIATTDVRALGRYYAADTAARFPMLTVSGTPQPVYAPQTLEITALEATAPHALAEVEALERAVLGYPRGTTDLRWILEQREGYLYRRDGRAVGFAFVGKEGAGPIAALEPDDLPSMLLHVEGRAHALGAERLSLQVPGVNAVAVRHLVARAFLIDAWVNLLMASRAFGQFDRFLPFSPLFL